MPSSSEHLQATIAAMARTPPSEWVASRMWIDGWYDAPEAGINVVDPNELRDAMVAESISPLVWTEWKSDADAEKHPHLTRLIERLVSTSQPTNVMIESEALPRVTAIWQLTKEGGDAWLRRSWRADTGNPYGGGATADAPSCRPAERTRAFERLRPQHRSR